MYSSETLPTAPRARGSNARETAQIVVELLRAGLEALDTNREAATRHLSKARLILETAGPSIFDGASVGLVPGGLAPWQVRRVKAYIEMNIDKPVTAKQLSAVVRLGPRHFQRAFKKCFGVGPHNFVLERRVRRAALPDRACRGIRGPVPPHEAVSIYRRHYPQRLASAQKRRLRNTRSVR